MTNATRRMLDAPAHSEYRPASGSPSTVCNARAKRPGWSRVRGQHTRRTTAHTQKRSDPFY